MKDWWESVCANAFLMWLDQNVFIHTHARMNTYAHVLYAHTTSSQAYRQTHPVTPTNINTHTHTLVCPPPTEQHIGVSGDISICWQHWTMKTTLTPYKLVIKAIPPNSHQDQNNSLDHLLSKATQHTDTQTDRHDECKLTPTQLCQQRQKKTAQN